MTTPVQNNIDPQQLSTLNERMRLIQQQISQVVIGQNHIVEMLMVALLADGHVLLEGVPGLAKTLTARLLSQSLKVDYKRIQFTPDLMPSDVIGTPVYNQNTNDFEFKQGPVFTQIALVDEINRAPAKTQSALFEAMEERQLSVDGQQYKLQEPFVVLATQNPVEHEGTYRLPEAQLDRFLFRLFIDYPEQEAELQMLKNATQNGRRKQWEAVNPVMDQEELLQYRQLVQQVLVEEKLLLYITQLVQKTRKHPAIYLGASPRASLGVMEAAKAMAVLNQRDFVTPDDIRSVFPHIINHRIILNPEKEMEGLTSQQIIRLIIEGVEVPR